MKESTKHIDDGFRKLCIAVYRQAIKDFLNPKLKNSGNKSKNIHSKNQREAAAFLNIFTESLYGCYLEKTSEQVINDINEYKETHKRRP